MATTRTTTKAPTKVEIQAHTRDDLREVYLLAFDQFAIIPSDIPIYTQDRVNMRYARELLGVLVNAGLLSIEDVNGDEEVWQVAQPGTHDDVTLEEATAFIDKWLDEKIPVATATTSTGESIKVTRTKPAKQVTGQCLCGCGENVAKSNYRPGHDARHAGNVARAIAAGGDREALLKELPSDKLQTKAEDMADRLIGKATAKSAAKDKVAEAPVIQRKVGRAVYEGVVDGGEFHYLDRKGNEKSIAFDKTTAVA